MLKEDFANLFPEVGICPHFLPWCLSVNSVHFPLLIAAVKVDALVTNARGCPVAATMIGVCSGLMGCQEEPHAGVHTGYLYRHDTDLKRCENLTGCVCVYVMNQLPHP